MKGLGALGVTAATAGKLLNLGADPALAADFDWKAHKGKTLKLLLNKHPYADAMIANLQTLQGPDRHGRHLRRVPGGRLFRQGDGSAVLGLDRVRRLHDRRLHDLDLRSGRLDRTTSTNGSRIRPRPTRTTTGTTFCRRARTPAPGMASRAAQLGSEDAKQWCIPWGFEQNNITYNQEMFEKAGVQAAEATCDELHRRRRQAHQGCRNGVYGIGVRGSRSWATIHPGFLSAYANFGQKDLNVSGDGKLSAAMNTAESKAFHKQWVEMIQESGPKNWSTYTWYQVGTDLGAGASAMIFDADILGYFMNGGDNKEAGKLAFAAFAANPAAEAPTPNVWIWSLAMT